MLQFTHDQTEKIDEINHEIYENLIKNPGGAAIMTAALQLARSATGSEESDLGPSLITNKAFLTGAFAARDHEDDAYAACGFMFLNLIEMEIHEVIAYLLGYRAVRFGGMQGEFSQMLGRLTLIHADAKALLMSRINACTE